MKKLLVILLYVTLFVNTVKGSFEYSIVNPDIAAVGGAFTSIADSAATIVYNPAGLSSINMMNIEFDYTSLYNIGAIENYYIGVVFPFIWKGSLGVALNYQGIDSSLPIKDFSEKKFYFSYGCNFSKWFAFGYSFKYFYAKYEENKGAVYSSDIGILINLIKFRVGIFLYDFYSPVITWYSGLKEVVDKNLRIGLSIKIIDNLILSYDKDKLLSNYNFSNNYIGARYRLDMYNLSFSVGVMNLYLNKYSFSAGMTYTFHGLSVKYTYVHHYDLGASHLIGVSSKY